MHGSNNGCDAYDRSKTRLVDSSSASTDRALRPPGILHTVTLRICSALSWFCAGLYAIHSTDVWAAQFLGGHWSSNFGMVSTLWNGLSRLMFATLSSKCLVAKPRAVIARESQSICWICTAHRYTFFRGKRTRSPGGYGMNFYEADIQPCYSAYIVSSNACYVYLFLSIP